ncbi:5'-nucleotidase [Candidatus Paraburkholderia kirkii]|nr:5'-nucleotidase [Candidatus Paraburkholderia kirkii]
MILSRSDPISGLRAFHSCREHGLAIERGVFTRGRSPFAYLKPLRASLFLSANPDDVRAALAAGFPAARVLPETPRAASRYADEIRIAFDGDAVLFSDEAERVFQSDGLSAFVGHETDKKDSPLPGGPLKPLLAALNQLQRIADENDAVPSPMHIRTALVTARSAPAHERAIRTLMAWNIEIDEAMFLGGLDKGEFLREFEPDFFFDDQIRHCEATRGISPTGHVLSGIANASRHPINLRSASPSTTPNSTTPRCCFRSTASARATRSACPRACRSSAPTSGTRTSSRG